jgi:hypothetical protein
VVLAALVAIGLSLLRRAVPPQPLRSPRGRPGIARVAAASA